MYSKIWLIRHALEEKFCVGKDRVSNYNSQKTQKMVKGECKWTSFYIFPQLYINVGKSREDSVLFNLQYTLLVVGSVCENRDSVTTDVAR